jgi:hypothetical protein
VNDSSRTGSPVSIATILPDTEKGSSAALLMTAAAARISMTNASFSLIKMNSFGLRLSAND